MMSDFKNRMLLDVELPRSTQSFEKMLDEVPQTPDNVTRTRTSRTVSTTCSDFFHLTGNNNREETKAADNGAGDQISDGNSSSNYSICTACTQCKLAKRLNGACGDIVTSGIESDKKVSSISECEFVDQINCETAENYPKRSFSDTLIDSRRVVPEYFCKRFKSEGFCSSSQRRSNSTERRGRIEPKKTFTSYCHGRSLPSEPAELCEDNHINVVEELLEAPADPDEHRSEELAQIESADDVVDRLTTSSHTLEDCDSTIAQDKIEEVRLADGTKDDEDLKNDGDAILSPNHTVSTFSQSTIEEVYRIEEDEYESDELNDDIKIRSFSFSDLTISQSTVEEIYYIDATDDIDCPNSIRIAERPSQDSEGKESPTTDSEGKERRLQDSEGKERPTSDSEGKERPTTDSEGKERLSQDSEGKERPTSDSEGNERRLRDSEEKERPPSDSEGKERPTTDSEGKERLSQDSEGKERPTSDSEGNERRLRDSEEKERPPSDSEGKERPTTDSEGKERLSQDSEGKERPTSDSEGNERRLRDSEEKERPPSDSEGKERPTTDSEGKERLSQDSEGKERPTSDSEGNERRLRDSEEKERPPSDSEGKERPTTDSEGKERLSQDSEGKERPTSDSEGNERRLRDSEEKERPPSDSEGKERPPSDSEGNERRLQDSEGKERPPSDSEGKERPTSNSEGKERPPSDSEGNNKPPSDSEGNNKPLRDSEEKDVPSQGEILGETAIDADAPSQIVAGLDSVENQRIETKPDDLGCTKSLEIGTEENNEPVLENLETGAEFEMESLNLATEIGNHGPDIDSSKNEETSRFRDESFLEVSIDSEKTYIEMNLRDKREERSNRAPVDLNTINKKRVLIQDARAGSSKIGARKRDENFTPITEPKKSSEDVDDTCLDLLSESELERIEKEAYTNSKRTRIATNFTNVNLVEEDRFYRPQGLIADTENNEDLVLPSWVTNPAPEPNYEMIRRHKQSQKEHINKILQEVLRLSEIISKVAKAVRGEQRTKDPDTAANVPRIQDQLAENYPTYNPRASTSTEDHDLFFVPQSSSTLVAGNRSDIFYAPQSLGRRDEPPPNLTIYRPVKLEASETVDRIRANCSADIGKSEKAYVPRSGGSKHDASFIFGGQTDKLNISKASCSLNNAEASSFYNPSVNFGASKRDWSGNKIMEYSGKFETRNHLPKESFQASFVSDNLYKTGNGNIDGMNSRKTVVKDAVFYSSDNSSSASRNYTKLPSVENGQIFFSKSLVSERFGSGPIQAKPTSLNFGYNLTARTNESVFYNGNE